MRRDYYFSKIMFDPKKSKASKAQEKEKNDIIKELKNWSLSIIPLDCQVDLDLDIREVICGDPTCAPIDTVFTLIWPNGGQGLFAIPSAPNEISQDDLIEFFPVSVLFPVRFFRNYISSYSNYAYLG